MKANARPRIWQHAGRQASRLTILALLCSALMLGGGLAVAGATQPHDPEPNPSMEEIYSEVIRQVPTFGGWLDLPSDDGKDEPVVWLTVPSDSDARLVVKIISEKNNSPRVPEKYIIRKADYTYTQLSEWQVALKGFRVPSGDPPFVRISEGVNRLTLMADVDDDQYVAAELDRLGVPAAAVQFYEPPDGQTRPTASALNSTRAERGESSEGNSPWPTVLLLVAGTATVLTLGYVMYRRRTKDQDA